MKRRAEGRDDSRTTDSSLLKEDSKYIAKPFTQES
jgi:hypothetical protein